MRKRRSRLRIPIFRIRFSHKYDADYQHYRYQAGTGNVGQADP